jgi:hypothetical protein
MHLSIGQIPRKPLKDQNSGDLPIPAYRAATVGWETNICLICLLRSLDQTGD